VHKFLIVIVDSVVSVAIVGAGDGLEQLRVTTS
jgi:hypothetical protein